MFGVKLESRHSLPGPDLFVCIDSTILGRRATGVEDVAISLARNGLTSEDLAAELAEATKQGLLKERSVRAFEMSIVFEADPVRSPAFGGHSRASAQP
jgi:hypothetical protein